MAKKKDPNHYPPGLNASKVKRIIDHYDKQTDEEAAAEIESARLATGTDSVWVEVPRPLLPKVRKLLLQHAKSA